jgi:hypothetical protein
MFLSLIFPNTEVNPDNGATVSKLEISYVLKWRYMRTDTQTSQLFQQGCLLASFVITEKSYGLPVGYPWCIQNGCKLLCRTVQLFCLFLLMLLSAFETSAFCVILHVVLLATIIKSRL